MESAAVNSLDSTVPSTSDRAKSTSLSVIHRYLGRLRRTRTSDQRQLRCRSACARERLRELAATCFRNSSFVTVTLWVCVCLSWGSSGVVALPNTVPSSVFWLMDWSVRDEVGATRCLRLPRAHVHVSLVSLALLSLIPLVSFIIPLVSLRLRG